MADHDIIFYTFSRSKVERKDFAHIISLFTPLPSGRRLREMMGTMVFTFEGYDDDPRELHSIPEVRAFCQSFFAAWPYWLFFGTLETDNLRTLILCCLPSITAVKSANSGNVSVEYDPVEMESFMVKALPAMKEAFGKSCLFEDTRRKREQEVLAYLGLKTGSL